MPSIRSRILYWLLKVQRPPFDPNKSVQQQRSLLENQGKRAPMPRNVDVQPIAMGDLPAEWLCPVGMNDNRAVLYLHGGGYTMGSRRTHRALGARIAIASQAPVLVIDYRRCSFRWAIVKSC
ncbi:MAG TPA: alpha/beta hydrolase [Anaerolineae bacterium]|nr:alpha/beta hydrolase [Anaerolineae bacterium]